MTQLDTHLLAPTPAMPVLSIRHGSPMHPIEESSFSRAWGETGAALPHPNAILVISRQLHQLSSVFIGGRERDAVWRFADAEFVAFADAELRQHVLGQNNAEGIADFADFQRAAGRLRGRLSLEVMVFGITDAFGVFSFVGHGALNLSYNVRYNKAAHGLFLAWGE